MRFVITISRPQVGTCSIPKRGQGDATGIRLLTAVFLCGLLSALLAAACSGGTEEQPTDSETQQVEPSGSGGPGAQSNESAGQQVPPSGSSGSPGQSSGSPGQVVTSSGDAPSLDQACDAFASAGGVGGFGGLSGGLANLISGVQGGPTIQAQYSKSPTSDEAATIAGFFEDALNDAFGGGVSAECYWEISASQAGESGLALWVALQLPFVPSSETIQAVQDSLAAKGATVAGSFSSTAGGEVSSTLMVELPFGQGGDSGGMLMFMEQFAIVIAGQGIDSGTSQSSQGSPPAIIPPPPPAPVQQASADTEGITDWFQGKLEDSLGVSLEVEGSFQSSAGGQSSLLVTFRIPEGTSLPSDVADQFKEIAESANANILATMSFGDVAMVNFENLKVEGVSASGAIALDSSQNNVTVTVLY